MTQPVVILGAGAVGREILGNLLARDPARVIAGFIDDDEKKWHRLVDGYPVLGGFDCLRNRAADWIAIGAVGSPASRRHMVDRARALGLPFLTITHPSVIVSAPGAPTLGQGVSISAGTIIAPSAHLHDHVFVSHGCIVNHDTLVEVGASLFPGAVVAGGVRVGPGALIGTRATVLQGLSIGPGAIIGAGALVTHDVPAGQTYAGVPARPFEAHHA